MNRNRLAFVLVTLFSVHSLLSADDAADKERKKNEAELAKLDAQLKKMPDNPTVHYRRAQALTKLERWDDGYAEAQKTMKAFIKAKDDLAWLLLETIDIGGFRIEVHFNMGPNERKYPDMGIVLPLSFRVWKKADKAVKDSKEELEEIIDFELGVMEGKPETAAFGYSEEGTHLNLGMLDVASSYKDIRVKAIDLIKKRHPQKEPKDPPRK